MLIMDSFAHTDITTEIYQYKESFVVKFKTEDFNDIRLTLNHTQIKVLADGLMAMANQAEIKELLENKSVRDLGNMKIKFGVLQGVEEQCPQNISSAPTEAISLSEIA